jgi:glycosyltransferase involved in cell wall biosynthesis
MTPRLLFASVHSPIDPSSGAALATRDVLELLTTRGWDCRMLAAGVLDYEQDTPLEAVLDGLGLPYDRVPATLGGNRHVEVLDLEPGGVRTTLLPTASSRAERAPSLSEAQALLELADQALARFRPHVVLTYGGHPASRELMRRARLRKVPVVFGLHNFAYDDPAVFADAAAVLVPSDYARRWYARRLGLNSTAIPYPLRRDRVVADDPAPQYVTFVNPQPAKGATVFARIARELGRRRPEIPLLVVEGRRAAGGLAAVDLDLSGLENLHRMANTPDPREFYRVSRAVLVPSLWRESFGRVAAEALANGLPVLASDRGALPETLGEAGLVFTVPERCQPDGIAVPTAREVAPWVAALERLWDDPAFEQAHRERARAEAQRWDDAVLADRYAGFLAGLASL